MRTTLLVVALFSIFISCKKDSSAPNNSTTVTYKGISYPDSVLYGKNILFLPDSTVLTDGANYELGAVLQHDATLKIIFQNFPVTDTISGHQTDWGYASSSGWVVGTYDDVLNTQQFTSSQSGSISAQLLFSAYGKTGHFRMDIYENGNTITRSKHFFWH